MYFPISDVTISPFLLIGIGFLVGILGGFFGVGGGFLIVPLLLFVSQINMIQAVSTSLIVISFISSIGFISHMLLTFQSSSFPSVLTLFWIVLGGIVGMLLGQNLTQKIANARLQKLFAIALAVMALTMLLFHFFRQG